MTRSLDAKLDALRDNPAARAFILADARDADMAWGVASPGAVQRGTAPPRLRTMPEFRDDIRRVIAQAHVDILLASASTMGVLAHEERLFDASPVTPAVRMNDTSDIWLPRGGRYAKQPPLPFSSATFDEAMFGTAFPARDQPPRVTLGLYSVTFTNDAPADRHTLECFKSFRLEAQRRGFRYFLEVFPPNIDIGLSPDQLPAFLNDQIARMLAGVPRAGRPAFLKIPYLGPAALEELVAFDPSVVVGILGGSSGTTLDAFALLHDARKHGARAALFGRRIKDAEDPLAFIAFMRRIVDDDLDPVEAVKAYRAHLQTAGITPRRGLAADLERTQP